MNSKKKTVSIPIDMKTVDEINKTLHDPSRLKIVAYLYSLMETDFTYLKNQTGFTWGRLASHLDKLQAEGYVELRKELVQRTKSSKKTPRTYIRLTIEGRRAFDKYRESIQQLFHKTSS
ncbi:MAG: transcriptional regulator [Candidatus Hodarchaeales archaeon]|jgi:DNA-binding MarR family transcriptional regulator